MTKKEEEIAKENWLVVVFGASDDLMEFRWAICDEIGAYEGTIAYIAKWMLLNWDVEPFGDIEEMADFLDLFWVDTQSNRIEASFGEEDVTWRYKTEISHSTFNIMEDDELYCVGIVFDMKDLK